MPIVAFDSSDPMTDGRQSARALEVRRGVLRLLAETSVIAIAEMPLASGRRADIVGLDPRGRFIIVEVKSSLEDLRADRKWPDYYGHCDRFYFATLADVPCEAFPSEEGLIIADRYGAEILREAREAPMAGATRRSMLLRFARLAAMRLDRVIAHHEAMGLIPPELPDDELGS
jgi:hypothetical protein